MLTLPSGTDAIPLPLSSQRTAKLGSAVARPQLSWAASWMTNTGTLSSSSVWASRWILPWTNTHSISGPRARQMPWTLIMRWVNSPTHPQLLCSKALRKFCKPCHWETEVPRNVESHLTWKLTSRLSMPSSPQREEPSKSIWQVSWGDALAVFVVLQKILM